MSDVWCSERRLWLEGADALREIMALDCLMVFEPMGVMRFEKILATLSEAPRWSDVEMTDRHTAQPTENMAVLAYKARGLRLGADPYGAVCTSSYVCIDGYWWLTHHHQTPVK